jgi:hypothetical protein
MFSSDVKPRFLKPGKCHIIQIYNFIFFVLCGCETLPGHPLPSMCLRTKCWAVHGSDRKQWDNKEWYVMRSFIIDTFTKYF